MPNTTSQRGRGGALAVAVMVATSLSLTPSVHAQQQQKPPAAKKPAAKSKSSAKPKRLGRKQAEAELRAGYAALQAKDTKKAIAALTRAIDAGTLRRKEIAKALYYRGIAYRTSEKPAKAISDLTSSLWLKGALTKKERADALAQRKQAYASAGVGGSLLAAPSSASSVAVAPTTSNSAAKPAAKKSKSTPKPSSKVASGPVGTWKSTTNPSPLPSTTGSTSSGGSGNPVSGVTSFFSNLFSGGSQSAAQPKSQTAALAKPNPNGTEPSVSSWSSNKKAKPVAKPAKARTAAVAKPAKPSGNYQIQVASYRDKGQADAAARQLAKKFGGQLSGRKPVVESTVVAGMGQFYQVRIKRFRNAKEPAALCKKLIAGGLDCFVRRSK